MKNERLPAKSCVPQLFAGQQPSHQWDLERLGQYAQDQHQLIVHGEKQLAPIYWRLGQALSLARKQFDHGQWGRFLKKWGIDRTRASKARSIFRTFSTEVQVQGKSVEEAYGERLRCQASTRERSRPNSASLLDFLNHLPQMALSLLEGAATIRRDEANDLLKAVARIIDLLKRLEKELRHRAATEDTHWE